MLKKKTIAKISQRKQRIAGIHRADNPVVFFCIVCVCQSFQLGSPITLSLYNKKDKSDNNNIRTSLARTETIRYCISSQYHSFSLTTTRFRNSEAFKRRCKQEVYKPINCVFRKLFWQAINSEIVERFLLI